MEEAGSGDVARKTADPFTALWQAGERASQSQGDWQAGKWAGFRPKGCGDVEGRRQVWIIKQP